MSISLTDALHQVHLEPGRIYWCQVGRFRVEVRVEDASVDLLPAPLKPSDVMLDPWTDLPAPPPVVLVQPTSGPPLLPDAPILVADTQR